MVDAASREVDARIEDAMAPFRLARELLISIPGFSTKTAEVFIAETGGDMSVFPTADHLASWARLSPRTFQSGPKNTSGPAGKGNPWLRGALGEAAVSAARTDTFAHSSCGRHGGSSQA